MEKAVLKTEEQLKQAGKTNQREKLLENDRIFVKDGKKCWFIPLASIRLFESKGNYTQIYFDGNSPLILRSLQQIEDSIDPKQFIRVNRAQIINIKYIKEIAEWFGDRLRLILISDEEVEVSRKQVNRFREIFSL